jgi:RNA polymerase sigma factor (sigma-70 family)
VCKNSTSRGKGLSKSELLLEFWAFRPRFLARIRRLVWIDRDNATDIFQAACLKFLCSKAVFHYPEAATQYFCRILRSLALDHLASDGRLVHYENVPESVSDPWPEWEKQQLFQDLNQALSRLSSEDRQMVAIYLNSHAEYIREQSSAFQLSRGAARHRMRKIIARLRMMVGESS